MYFVSGYKYEIPKGIHYTWSSTYEMEDHGVFRSSDVEDLFYLISMDRKTFLLAYNAKMFEYCESNEGNNKYPPAKPGVFHRRAKPYVSSPRVTSRKYDLPAAKTLLLATRKRV